MPELPEVEVVRAGLAPAVTGATVLGVTVLDERALTRHAGDGIALRGRAHRPRASSRPRDAASSCGCRSTRADGEAARRGARRAISA